MALSHRDRRYLRTANQRGRRPILAPDLVARVDWILLGACALITILGLVMVYSSSRNIDQDPSFFLKRQLVALVIGIVVAIAILRVDYRKFRDFSLIAYVAVVAMLLFVLTPVGSEAGGAQAWFQLPFGLQLQPSEFAKFGLVVALAGYLNEHRGDIDPWRLTVIVGLAVVPIGLVQLQPDLGTNLVLLFGVIGLLAVAGVKGRYLLALALVAATLVFVVMGLGILKQYQVDRLTSPFGGGGDTYNQDQSVNTLGAGGPFGQGLFKGSQTQLGFVPAQQTDFIFTAVGEELGFLGAATLLGLFAIVMWRTWRTALLARDYYGTLVCAGVLSIFGFMIFENIGMAMGIMPVTGIPLPFMSYGGSSLITCWALAALVANVHARRFS